MEFGLDDEVGFGGCFLAGVLTVSLG